MPWIHFYYNKNWVDNKIISNVKKLLNHNNYYISEYKWEKYSFLNFNNNKKINKNNFIISYKWYLIWLDWYFCFEKTEYFEIEKNLKIFIDLYINNENNAINKISDWKFNLLIFNLKTEEINIYNDRFWLNNCYYYKDNNAFIFSHEIKWIIPYLDKINKKELDPNAIYDFISYGFINWDKSYIKWVKMLNPASNLNINKWIFNTKYYWIPKFNYKYNTIDLLKDTHTTFNKIIKKYLKSFKNIWLYMSWWYDSRLILANILDLWEKEKLKWTYTFWDNRSNEVKIVNKLKNKFKFPNTNIIFKENNIENFVFLNEWEIDTSLLFSI